MTGQLPDRVTWDGTDWELVAARGGGLWHPQQVGLVTVGTHTANWRGWVARYVVDDDVLVLRHVTDVGLLPEAGDPPRVGGVEAAPDGHGAREYRDVDVPVAFSGRLALGADLDFDRYVHLGFQSPSAYDRLWVLRLEHGRVLAAVDRSGVGLRDEDLGPPPDDVPRPPVLPPR